MDGYRIAGKGDLPDILHRLKSGDHKGVLVRSLYRSDTEPYALLELCRGPFTLQEGILSGFANNGEHALLRIADSSLSHVEIKLGNEEWFGPELSSIVLLIPAK